MRKFCYIIIPKFNSFISDKIFFHDIIATNDIQINFKNFKISEGVNHFYMTIGIKECVHPFILM